MDYLQSKFLKHYSKQYNFLKKKVPVKIVLQNIASPKLF